MMCSPDLVSLESTSLEPELTPHQRWDNVCDVGPALIRRLLDVTDSLRMAGSDG